MKTNLTVWAFPGFESRRFNVYTSLLYHHLKKLGASVFDSSTMAKRDLVSKHLDIYHVHWPEMSYDYESPWMALKNGMKFLLKITNLKLKGTKVVWTVHNLKLQDEQAKQTDRLFFNIWTRLVNGVIFLSDSTTESIYQTYPTLKNKPFLITPQGHYRYFFDLPPKQIEAQSTHLFHLLYFGKIKRYKNLQRLVIEFSKIIDKNLRLTVIGFCQDEKLACDLKTLVKSDERISLIFKEVPECEIPSVMENADLVILPFKKILNSASAMVSLSCNRPLLIPNLGSLKDYEVMAGKDWVQLYEGDITAEIISRAIGKRKKQWLDKPVDLSPFDWEPIARKTKTFFESL